MPLKGGGVLGPRDIKDIPETRHYLINSLNLQAISLSPLGGRGQGEGGYATADEATPHPNPLPSQGRGDLVASI